MNDDKPFPTESRLGILLHHYRTQANLSQDELSRESGIDASTISLTENGKTKPWPMTLESIAAVLASHIKGLTKEQIYAHLLDARSNKPADHRIPPELLTIADRFAVYDPTFRLAAARAVEDLLDKLEDIYQLGRRG
jgi:transcriptional regulator with XRE-family HTH domain